MYVQEAKGIQVGCHHNCEILKLAISLLLLHRAMILVSRSFMGKEDNYRCKNKLNLKLLLFYIVLHLLDICSIKY